MRNPRRTASTAAALMIGLAVVSLIAIVGESTKATFASAIDDQTKTDFIISPDQLRTVLARGRHRSCVRASSSSSGSGAVVEWRSGTVEIDGTPNEILGVTPNFRR